MAAVEAIRCHRDVPVSPDKAFALFADGLGGWWPSEYTWASESLESIAIEPFEGGRCYERGPHGFACDWGRVLAWEPPQRLAFTWQIDYDRLPQPNPERASEVEVGFAAAAGGSHLVLEHRCFERHGEEGVGYRAALAGERGWPYILDRYADLVAEVGAEFTAVQREPSASAAADQRLSGRGGRIPAESREPGHLSTDELMEVVERASRRMRE